MAIKIIGIIGRKRHGKDSIGNFLVNKYNFIRLGFADNLKECCRAVFGFNDSQLYGDLKETNDSFWNVTPRKTFEFVGTDLFRNQLHNIIPSIGNDIWIKSLERKIINLHENNNNLNIVFTDVRFQNEIDFIKKHGGKIIKVFRPNILSDSNHESETNSDNFKFDYEIFNNGSLQELNSKIETIYNNI